MAQKSINEELKQDAIRSLAEGREEITSEMLRMRQHISPVRVIERVVRRNPSLTMLFAATAGFILAKLFFRRKPSLLKVDSPVVMPVAKPPTKPILGAILFGALGLLARTITPTLIKSTIIPLVLSYLAKKQPGSVSDQRRGRID